MNKVLWVLDTNVVLDLFHFNDAAARPLRRAFDAGALSCAASPATLAEWRRVLGYPEFGLDAAAQATLYARYADRIHPQPDGAAVRLPRCRDADDQKFLQLAARCGATLVSKDRALLTLARRVSGFAILAPDEAVGRLPPAA
ncbi:MAG: putative toxin-antitoxin system toxin component, PIN family [Gammaproteobacteria bacterium]